MKRIFIMALVAALASTQALALSVAGSKHDMIAGGFAAASGGAATEVCIFCHTPHGAQVSVTKAPLWNNTAATTVNAAMYNSPTINFAFTQASINATDALLCLACHDSGVGMPVNMPNVGSLDPGASVMGVNTLIGTSMSNDHPVGMDLTGSPEGIDPRINPIAYITGAAGFNENPFYGVNNTMWCSSCHDVHDNADVPFLRKTNAGSALCKTCHNK